MKDALPVIWLAAAILVTAGCNRKGQQTSVKDNAVATVAPANEAVTPAINEGSQALEGPADPGMTEQLRTFIQEHGRLPADFAEFSRARLDSVPRVPQGMKWAIDSVTQEVKLVKQ